MDKFEIEIIDKRLVYDNFYKMFLLKIRLEDGSVVERHVEDHGQGAAVLAYDPGRKVAVLIMQPRAAVITAGEQPLLEVIAGLIDSGSAEQTIRNEALEEAGLSINRLTFVANIWKIPAFSLERVQLYLAEYRIEDKIGSGGGIASEGEAIEVHEIPLSKLKNMVFSGLIRDAKTLILIQHLILTKPDLFND